MGLSQVICGFSDHAARGPGIGSGRRTTRTRGGERLFPGTPSHVALPPAPTGRLDRAQGKSRATARDAALGHAAPMVQPCRGGSVLGAAHWAAPSGLMCTRRVDPGLGPVAVAQGLALGYTEPPRRGWIHGLLEVGAGELASPAARARWANFGGSTSQPPRRSVARPRGSRYNASAEEGREPSAGGGLLSSTGPTPRGKE